MLNLSSTLKTNKAQPSNAKRSLLTASAILALTIPQITYGQNVGGSGEEGFVGLEAQNPPPSIETNSPGGVDMSTGAFSLQATDLQIGDGNPQNGLSLVRSYNSATGASFSGFLVQGWSHNWARRVSVSQYPRPDGLHLCAIGTARDDTTAIFVNTNICQNYYFIVSSGNGSAKYTHGGSLSHTGSNIPGVYAPIEEQNKSQRFEFIGNLSSPNVHNTGYYKFTDSDGTENYFHPLNSAIGAQQLNYEIAPNGLRTDVNYIDQRIKSIFTNIGYALIFEYDPGPTGFSQTRKACVVNLATTYVDPTGDCPTDSLSVTYDYDYVDRVYENGTSTGLGLVGVTNALGETSRYEYDDGGHVDCIKEPGQSQCRVRMTYSHCIQDPSIETHNPNFRAPGLHLNEKVLRQDFIAGEFYTYKNYKANGNPVPDAIVCGRDSPFDIGPPRASYSDSQGNVTDLQLTGNKAISVTDPIGRVTQNDYGSPAILPWAGAGLIRSQTLPEGNKVEVDYNDRGLVMETRVIAKPGSSVSALVTHASYADACTPTTRKTCNQPLSTTDANGNTTDYTYDLNHGGVLSVKGPAVSGVRPETRYSYVQRYAWLKDSSGGFVQAADPVWMLFEERSCINSNMNANGTCAGGAAQLVVTSYDYDNGSVSKGSNLWVLGTAVTSGGKTLRTCYGYDDYGRRTSETQPKGAGGSCS